jgi:hypothetical protein
MMKRVPVLVVLLFLLATAVPVRAQSAIAVSDVRVVPQFGKSVTFLARIESTTPIHLATLTVREQAGADQTLVLTVAPDGSTQYTYDVTARSIEPFARIQFWFDVTFADGTLWRSDPYFFDYIDNRFSWQERDNGMLHVHWVNGDSAFGDAALAAAQRGLEKIAALTAVDLGGRIDIWIYPSADELRGALALGGQAWTAGHASPELGVALVSVAAGPEQGLELERQVPHELQHVLLYRALGPNYDRLPVWLREGMASLAELNPNPDQQTTLDDAAAQHTLIPLADLCAPFPDDPASAYLAYAEARSFTQYLLDHYGASGLAGLAAAYADGLDCEQGADRALHATLSDLDLRWREDVLGEERGGVIAANLMPYFLLFVLVAAVPVAALLGRIFTRREHDRGQS